MLKDNISDEKVKSTLIDYLIKNNKFTPDKEEIKRVKERLLWGRNSSLTMPMLRQLYDLYNFEDEKTSIYLNFIKLIEENFSLDRNIVEVAGGPIPRLAFQIASRQTKGKVTVYDPLMHPTDYNLDNLVIKRESFTSKTKVPKGSLLIGFMPCEATEVLLRTAHRRELDFIVALCGCSPNNNDVYYDDSVWLDNMEYLAHSAVRDTKLGELKRASLEAFDDPYPVLYNKRLIKK